MNYALTFLLACSLSLVGTEVVRRAAVRSALLDIPNERSSHTKPTPRGGGLAIAATFMLSCVALWLFYGTPMVGLGPVLAASLVIAIVGLIDDKTGLSAGVRLIVQIAAATYVVFSVDLEKAFPFVDRPAVLHVAIGVVSVLALTWMTNAFNFMDGIDGIAATQAVFATLTSALLVDSSFQEWRFLYLALAGSCFGFLLLNWPPANIFMGDVGSAFLGFLLGALSLGQATATHSSVWTMLTLMSLFLADATATLVRRALTGQRITSAHRSHAYQRLGRILGGNLQVLAVCLVVNVFWVAPIAWVGAREPEWSLNLFLIAVTPLAIGCWCLGAGQPDKPTQPQ